MLKKIGNVFLSSIIILSSFLILEIEKANAATDGALLFNPASASVTVGQTVNLVARVNPGTNDVTAVELDVTFNPVVLRLDSITRSNAFDTTLAAATINNNNGTGSMDVGSLSGAITTTSDVATFSFTTLSAATNSPVSFAISSNAAAEGSYIVATRTGAQVTVSSSGGGDSTAPTVTAFAIPSVATSLTIPITTFTATDGTGVTGYMITESSSTPSSGASGWSSSVPANYTFSSEGNKTLYAWAKDAAGNVSTSLNDSVVITLPVVDQGPVVSNGVPTGTLAKDTKSVTISVVTDENATCKFSEDIGVAYDSMSIVFTTTGETTHYYTIEGTREGRSYDYFVKCMDSEGNKNLSDYKIEFSIKSDSKKEEKRTKRKISNSKSSVRRGETFVQSGKRFSKNAEVLLYFSKQGGGYYSPMKVKTSSSGKFSVSYKVNKSPGKYSWYALDSATGKKSKSKTYTVR